MFQDKGFILNGSFFTKDPVLSKKNHVLRCAGVFPCSCKTSCCYIISMNFTPKTQPELPEKMVLSYVFQVGLSGQIIATSHDLTPKGS